MKSGNGLWPFAMNGCLMGSTKPLWKTLGLSSDPGASLQAALTHRSAVSSAGQSSDVGSLGDLGDRGYELLEFLGDRVLGLLVAEMLLDRFPKENEGAIAKRHSALVRKETLAEIALEIGLAPHIQLSYGEDQAGGRKNPAILSDVMEAILAVVYRAEGILAARRFVQTYWTPWLERDLTPPRDAKTTLQEWLQSKGAALPVYSVIGQSGPDHAPRFEIEVRTNDHGTARAEGGSKREAEQTAAAELLRLLGVF